MADIVTKRKRSEMMRGVKSKDTAPEMVVRKLVHRLGYRYRLHRKDLPGKPDLTFSGRKKIIFVHGCFWHQHPDCKTSGLPKTNREFWSTKLRQNVERDKLQIKQLEVDGWQVRVVWECEVKDLARLERELSEFLESREE